MLTREQREQVETGSHGYFGAFEDDGGHAPFTAFLGQFDFELTDGAEILRRLYGEVN